MKYLIRSAAQYYCGFDRYINKLAEFGLELVDNGPDQELTHFVTLNSLEDLERLRKAVDSDLVLRDGRITIYDDYLE